MLNLINFNCFVFPVGFKKNVCGCGGRGHGAYVQVHKCVCVHRVRYVCVELLHCFVLVLDVGLYFTLERYS